MTALSTQAVVQLSDEEFRLPDVLVAAPHPDDAEVVSAGTFMKMRAAAYRRGALHLPSGEPTPRGCLATRAKEPAAATAKLGLTWRENLGVPNRRLEATLEARRHLAEVIRRAGP